MVKLHILKHCCGKNRQQVWENDFRVLGNNNHLNFKQKVSEALLIKHLKPIWNVKGKSGQFL